jgi:hypothetical protein
MLSVITSPNKLNVVILNVVMLNVVAPNFLLNRICSMKQIFLIFVKILTNLPTTQSRITKHVDTRRSTVLSVPIQLVSLVIKSNGA